MVNHCPHCKLQNTRSGIQIKSLIKHGSFVRRSDLELITRYLCKICGKTFSDSTLNLCFRQKKRELNSKIFELYASGVSQRRVAKYLRINPKTAVRKFLFVGIWAHLLFEDQLKKSFQNSLINEVQFDDLETFEHTKLKPLSVTMAVEANTRKILGFRVARMPAKGLLVKKSLKKYGPRIDERKAARNLLFQDLKSLVSHNAIFSSDQNPHYSIDLKKHFPNSSHFTTKGRRGCVTGQGELKAGGYDPLFSLNHTFAMLRSNINRLFRRTWNTTKLPERLDLHLGIYALYHNHFILKQA